MRHIMPNLVGPLIVCQARCAMPHQFAGLRSSLGVIPPTPDGLDVSEGRELIGKWVGALPDGQILTGVLGFNA